MRFHTIKTLEEKCKSLGWPIFWWEKRGDSYGKVHALIFPPWDHSDGSYFLHVWLFKDHCETIMFYRVETSVLSSASNLTLFDEAHLRPRYFWVGSDHIEVKMFTGSLRCDYHGYFSEGFSHGALNKILQVDENSTDDLEQVDASIMRSIENKKKREVEKHKAEIQLAAKPEQSREIFDGLRKIDDVVQHFSIHHHREPSLTTWQDTYKFVFPNWDKCTFDEPVISVSYQKAETLYRISIDRELDKLLGTKREAAGSYYTTDFEELLTIMHAVLKLTWTMYDTRHELKNYPNTIEDLKKKGDLKQPVDRPPELPPPPLPPELYALHGA